MDPWINGAFAIAGVFAGSGLLLLGGHLSERGQNRRAKEQQALQLWERSLDPARRVQETMLQTMRATDPPDPWDPDPRPYDEDRFLAHWDDTSKKLRLDVSHIPGELRDALQTTVAAIDWSWAMANKAGYGEGDQQKAANQLATLGFDAAAEWIRGERVMSEGLRARVTEVARTLHRARAIVEQERTEA